MIKKWSKFLESNIELESQKRDFEEFKMLLQKLIDDSDYGLSGQFYRNYSYTAQANKGDLDPERDFQIVNNWMTENGWPLDRAEKFAKNWQGGTFSDECLRKTVSECAPVDYYLYKITQGEFPLQGFEWSFFGDDDWSQEELSIRFRYGWHLTRYGRMCIQQNMSIQEYFDKVTDDSGFGDLLIGFAAKFILRLNRDEALDEVNQCFFAQDNECYLDLDSYSKWLVSESSSRVSKETITEDLTNFFRQLGLNVRVIGDDMIIKYKDQNDN